MFYNTTFYLKNKMFICKFKLQTCWTSWVCLPGLNLLPRLTLVHLCLTATNWRPLLLQVHCAKLRQLRRKQVASQQNIFLLCTLQKHLPTLHLIDLTSVLHPAACMCSTFILKSFSNKLVVDGDVLSAVGSTQFSGNKHRFSEIFRGLA